MKTGEGQRLSRTHCGQHEASSLSPLVSNDPTIQSPHPPLPPHLLPGQLLIFLHHSRIDFDQCQLDQADAAPAQYQPRTALPGSPTTAAAAAGPARDGHCCDDTPCSRHNPHNHNPSYNGASDQPNDVARQRGEGQWKPVP